MTERVLDLTGGGAYLKVHNRQLLIERHDEPPCSVPLAELSALIIAHPQVLCTQTALAGVVESGGAVIVCGHDHRPVGLMLSIDGHCTQTERFMAQAAAKKPLKKRLWKTIVRTKVLAQAALLQTLRGGDHGIRALAGRVRSGDPSNVEAQASRRYWPALFDDPDFRRRREGGGVNTLLNYGYAVLRATMGRAICAVGLHPSIGVHHHNRYNAFCLADDLMEPYRPVVDEVVVEHAAERGMDAPLDPRAKRALLEALTGRYRVDGEVRTLFDAANRTASSLAKVFLAQEQSLWLPKEMDRVPPL